MHKRGGNRASDSPPRTHSLINLRITTYIFSRHGTPPVPPGFESTLASEAQSRRSTPTIPPGFSGKAPSAIPHLNEDGTVISRPGSRRGSLIGIVGVVGSRPATPSGSSKTVVGSLKRQVSQQVLPALPLRPGTPRLVSGLGAAGSGSRAGSPTRVVSEMGRRDVEETPTKGSRAAIGKKVEVPAAQTEAKKNDVIEKAEDKVVPATPARSAVVEKSVQATPPKSAGVAQPFQATASKPVKQDKTNVENAVPASATPAKQAPTKTTEPIVAPPVEASKPERKSSGPLSMQPASKGAATVQTSDMKATPVTPSKQDKKYEKRKHPGKLDITAAVNERDEATAAAIKATPVETVTPAQPQRNVSQTASIASKPESPIVSSPLVKNAPRTLRVMQTPKTETPPSQIPIAAMPNLPGSFPGVRQPSRQPSVASINPPGTPSSEQVSISDNLSMTSTSMSRANSPPPGASAGGNVVGSAPVRAKTKSQMKKERQERAKAIEEEKARSASAAFASGEGSGAVTPVADEPAQEAIQGRKKKAKKEKEVKPPKPIKAAPTVKETTTATASSPKDAAASQPVSPAQKVVAAEPAKTAPVVEQVAPKPPTPTKTPVFHGPAPPPMVPAPHEPSPPPTPTLTAASLLADLKNQAPEIQKCLESLFRAPTNTTYKASQPISPKDLQNPAFWKSDFKINLTKDEVDALLKGAIPSISYGGQTGRVWDRGLVTQTGAHLRALTEELEQRFLDLEKALKEMPDELRFKYSKPQNEIRFPGIDLESLKRGFAADGAYGAGAGGGQGGGRGDRGPSVMEQMVQDGNSLKKGAFLVDEAGRYVDEFVMPPVTPPPSAGGNRGNGQNQGQANAGANAGGAGGGAEGQTARAVQGYVNVDLEVVERQVQEARRFAEEGEGRLRKMIKRNRRLLGLG
ncbi:hypothetical protein LTR78_001850 [Recurvomyces mirabilis]|uniref:Uncharacterized protein n=1 Tax=Recurvomyces mirabilis TaxID=574656 RepID=A0AAE0WUU7_9PEZI|nr:hypothetical protein LTR78_001850 [Recurvomyces mirabilis]KAK5156710.1 hypothetical protein LTS14_004922 [Recurvomyces mirabilis]